MKKIALLLIVLISAAFFFHLGKTPSIASEEKSLFIIPVEGTIDLGLSAFIKRALKQANEEKAAAVVLKINTFGGRVDAADEIVNNVQELATGPTFAYITHSAWSAGALIALSCESIVMNEGSSIGSAEPRMMGMGQGQQATDEKIVSALRAKFKATAQANNHSANLAEAMVDKEIVLMQVNFKDNLLILTPQELEEKKAKENKKLFKNEKTLCAKDKLLNLTADEAKNLALSNETVKSEEEFFTYLKGQLDAKSITFIKKITPKPTWSENIVRFLTHPIVSSLLLSLGFLGILFELKMPGWGVSGTLGVLFLILFFWGHYLVGLANWLDLAIFAIGIIFLLIELLVVPGFGIIGISGFILVISGLILTLLKHPFTLPSFELSSAILTIAWAFIFTFALGILGFRFLPQTGFFKRIVLQTSENKDQGFQTKSLPAGICVGKLGKSKTILHPSGRAIFDNEVLDVTTLGEFIPKNEIVIIAKIEGNKVFVDLQRS
ncbi:MAG: nodulation protein NfeD [Candidatus Omnitrophica bacterium]|nr:nodulation protein NfeD [Candidatus Omnitrophota bacterium]